MSNNNTNDSNSNKLSIIVGLILIALIIGFIIYYNYQSPPKVEQNIYEPIVSDLSYDTESSVQSSTSSINNSGEQMSASSINNNLEELTASNLS